MRKILKGLILIFFFSLPLGTKKFISILLPQFFEYSREFSSLFLYGTDILAVVIIILSLIYFKKIHFGKAKIIQVLSVFSSLLILSLFFVSNFYYSLFIFIELAIAILSALAIHKVIADEIVDFRSICVALGVSAFFEAVIAVIQFHFQKSLGLWFLGEPVVDVATQGVARVTIAGISYLRSFGTLPHANILASFLIVGFISIAYLYFTANKNIMVSRSISIFGILTILYALVLTFSRSGWIIAGISTLVLLIYGFSVRELRKTTTTFLLVILASSILITYYLWWAIAPRSSFVKGEASVDHRVFYNEIGLSLVKKYPLGVGVGNQVITAAQNGLYLEKGLKQAWLAQPIHNIYILIMSEVGVFGLFTFLLLIFYSYKAVRIRHPKTVFAGIMFGSLLLFGLVDHFSWDLHAGRLMFFVMLGTIMGLSMDNKSSSFNG
ncbi:MAG: O-antigen ligase family protein [Candidatus Jorgensenbacteria bacterium]|nr:O-antigen ligase family protein [Candidatus Jorgensenbacteria bacterium]